MWLFTCKSVDCFECCMPLFGLVQARLWFRSFMWILSIAGISKRLCTSEVASATCTSVRMQGILRLGANFLTVPDFTTICLYGCDIEASGTFHQHKRSKEQAEMVLFAGHMYTAIPRKVGCLITNKENLTRQCQNLLWVMVVLWLHD